MANIFLHQAENQSGGKGYNIAAARGIRLETMKNFLIGW